MTELMFAPNIKAAKAKVISMPANDRILITPQVDFEIPRKPVLLSIKPLLALI